MRELKFRQFCSSEGHEYGMHYVDPYRQTLVRDGDWHTMQATGLHDKNGKEIYEGDIIEGKYENRFEVWWSEKDLRWETSNDIVINGSLAGIVEPEVIGNIYENPNLLGS